MVKAHSTHRSVAIPLITSHQSPITFKSAPLRPPRPLADVAKGGDGAKSALREASIFADYLRAIVSIVFAQILFCFRLGAVCQGMHASAESSRLRDL
jgi:hypothetical protein